MRKCDIRSRATDSQKNFLFSIRKNKNLKKTSCARYTDGSDDRKDNFCLSRYETLINYILWILLGLTFLHLVFIGIYLWVTNPHGVPGTRVFSQWSNSLSSFSSPSKGPEFLRLLGTEFENGDQHHHTGDEVEEEKLIPRLIHQTYKSRDIPSELRPYVNSWIQENPSWTYLFYDDKDCLAFVEREFPQYLEAYKSLPKNVERSDFFRYLVTLRYGGVYADLDTECKYPFDDLIQSTDSMVVGWEADLSTEAAMIKRHFVRKRQILQWVFAASPGHPVLQELCDFIAEHALTVFSNISNFNTLQKTGPGMWTDLIIKHAKQQQDVKILPKVSFGVHPSATDGIAPDSDGILVQHHFSGSWKNGGWKGKCLFPTFLCSETQIQTPVKNTISTSLFPVNTNFSPSFTIMVYPHSQGPLVGDSDVSNEITLRGVWQAGNTNPTSPRVVDVIASSLGEINMNLKLLDIGAGLGFFSLAVASRNHPVIAVEAPGLNAEAFRSSIKRNNFTDEIKYLSTVDDIVDQVYNRCLIQQTLSVEEIKSRQDQKWRLKANSWTLQQENCDLEIGAVRVGHTGWSFWHKLNGTEILKVANPEIILLEFSPWRIKQSSPDLEPLDFLHKIGNLGYTEVYHNGELCNRRWNLLSRQLKDSKIDDQQPQWCTVMPHEFNLFLQIDDHEKTPPENVLFVKRKLTS